MSWRHLWQRRPAWYGWPWGHVKTGRIWKRRLAKAERAFSRGRTRERSVTNLRSTVNWKNW